MTTIIVGLIICIILMTLCCLFTIGDDKISQRKIKAILLNRDNQIFLGMISKNKGLLDLRTFYVLDRNKKVLYEIYDNFTNIGIYDFHSNKLVTLFTNDIWGITAEKIREIIVARALPMTDEIVGILNKK